jgi:hypothetical protein
VGVNLGGEWEASGRRVGGEWEASGRRVGGGWEERGRRDQRFGPTRLDDFSPFSNHGPPLSVVIRSTLVYSLKKFFVPAFNRLLASMIC